jgi:hypothetical protein
VLILGSLWVRSLRTHPGNVVYMQSTQLKQLTDSHHIARGSGTRLAVRLRRWVMVVQEPIINASTESLSRYRYDMWGQATKTAGALDADFGYAGYYVHSRSGLNLTVYRAYNPTLGRWINHSGS